MKPAIFVASTTLLTAGSADVWDLGGQVAVGVVATAPIGSSDEEQRRYREAYRSPNATNSVLFSMGDNEGWTWRVNITEIMMPDGGPDPASNIIAISHDLQWPNASSTLNETMETLYDDDDDDARLCASIFTSPISPNVTNQYQNNNDSSCMGVLGQECLDSILLSTRSGRSANSCPTINSREEACLDIFGGPKPSIATAISPGANASLFTGHIASDTNTTGLVFLNSGDNFYLRHSAPFERGDNEDFLQQARSMLHMAVFTGPEGIQEAVCTRIDPTIDDEEVSPISANDGDQSDDEQDDDESAAVANMPTRLWLSGLLALVATVFTSL